jgi:hypothetical protein
VRPLIMWLFGQTRLELNRSPSGKVTQKPALHKVAFVGSRGLLGAGIAMQIVGGFVILPYTRLFFHGLDRLAVEFPSSQRLRLFSEARARYERWATWRRQRSATVRIAMFILSIGTAAVLWWLSV